MLFHLSRPYATLRDLFPDTCVQDRANISNARVAGLQKELHLTDYQVCPSRTIECRVADLSCVTQYTVALTVTYVYGNPDV